MAAFSHVFTSEQLSAQTGHPIRSAGGTFVLYNKNGDVVRLRSALGERLYTLPDRFRELFDGLALEAFQEMLKALFLEHFRFDIDRFRDAVRVDDEEIALLQFYGSGFVFGLGEHTDGEAGEIEPFDCAGLALDQR